MPVPPGATANVKIGRLAAAHATGPSVSIVLTAYRVPPVTAGNLSFPVYVGVSLATPPDGGEQLSQDLVIALLSPDVVNTVAGYDSVANQLSLAFLAGPQGRPVTRRPAPSSR